MNNRRFFQMVCLILFLALGSGCAGLFGSRVSEEEARARVNEAQKHHQVIKRLNIEETFGKEIERSGAALERAVALLGSGDRPEAVEAAEESLGITEKILESYYLNHIAELAQNLKQELKQKMERDPETPLSTHLSSVDEIIEEAQGVQQDDRIVSLSKVVADLEKIMQVTQSLRTHLSQTLQSDISFAQGKYGLSEKGKEPIDRFIGKVLADKRTYLQLFPDKTVVTKIKVVGYTDALNFGPNSALVPELIRGMEADVPDGDPPRRQFLNQRLSRFRADTIADYIRQILAPAEAESERYEADIQAIGRGENLPAGIQAPYPVMDDRRRISRIYVYTTTR